MIHGHGDDKYQYEDIQYNFSSNVNPYGIPPGLLEHLKSCLEKLGAYPEPLAENLATQIERTNNLSKGSVLVTNGAVEAFYLLASLFQNKKSLIYTPSFSEYEDACRLYKHSIDFCDNKLFPAETKQYDLVWICNPNNPDGKVFDIEVLRNQIRQHPQTFFVLDEAYVEFVNKNISLEKEASQMHNLIVIRSLTKRFSIPGLRLGYLVCSPNLLSKIQKRLMPWRINSLALEAGMYCFSGKHSDEFRLSELLEESQRIQTEINKIEGFDVYPSLTSFFLVKGPEKASGLKEKLAIKHKILIRDAGNFRGLPDVNFRISTQRSSVNNRLIEVLKSWTY